MRAIAPPALSAPRDGDRRVVTWLRDGHTCVLSGPTAVKREVLLKLAAAGAT